MKQIQRNVHKIDATEQAVGRIASQIAILLRGKNKPEFLPHIDGGDVVRVSNITKLKFTGKKIEQKKYFKHSGYPGGMKELKLKDVFQKNPNDILMRAVKQMLPNNKLRDGMLKRLVIEN
ncbi:50S ribosomal protein L13 [Patescibacteria group bacterium]|nr:50S ribosomal protein L13 [Patescibacteria group bacterium]